MVKSEHYLMSAHRTEASFLICGNVKAIRGTVTAARVWHCSKATSPHPPAAESLPRTSHRAAEPSSALLLVSKRQSPHSSHGFGTVPKMLLSELNRLPCSFHDGAWVPRSGLKKCVGEKHILWLRHK